MALPQKGHNMGNFTQILYAITWCFAGSQDTYPEHLR